jgi:uncharacterized protein CbrC (UPF0167 family)
MELPKFKYHPDPIATGSIVESAVACRSCGQARGYVYDGLPIAEEILDKCICPWCIADGTAHAKFEACFVDEDGIGGHGLWDGVPAAVTDEVAHRTPGFRGWQEEEWWTHCGDAAAYLGMAGAEEVTEFGPELADQLRRYASFEDNEDWREVLGSFSKVGAPTAYLFRCLHCGTVGGYWDCD